MTWRKRLAIAGGLLGLAAIVLSVVAISPLRVFAQGRSGGIGLTVHPAVDITPCTNTRPGYAHCDVIARHYLNNYKPAPLGRSKPNSAPLYPTSCPQPSFGYTPCDLVSAYNLAAAGGGHSFVTVAVVDAFDDPDAESDLGVYRSEFGLPACTTANGCFRKTNQTGGTSYPPTPPSNDDWVPEISLDLDMVSAICPNCKIVLVEATSDALSNLLTADSYAATQANYISNSWSASEFSGETSFDPTFEVGEKVFTFATGDNGYAAGPQYPATSPYVVAVGGTSLTTSTDSRGWTETAWSDAGSGCSTMEPQPAWQVANSSIQTLRPSGCDGRVEADVSATADPNNGVDVYDSYDGYDWNFIFGGTSCATPIIASVYALANHPGSHLPELHSYQFGASPLYLSSHESGLYDVTTGINGSCGDVLCSAGSGWDGPTGLGTPDGDTAFVGP